MKTKLLAVTTVLCLTATSSWAVPLLNVTPGGLQGGTRRGVRFPLEQFAVNECHQR